MSGPDLDEPLRSSTPDTTSSLLMASLMAVPQPWPSTGRGTASHRRSRVDIPRNVHPEPDHLRERVITNEADLRAALVTKLLENWDAGDPAANDELIGQLGEWHRTRQGRPEYSAGDTPSPQFPGCRAACSSARQGGDLGMMNVRTTTERMPL